LFGKEVVTLSLLKGLRDRGHSVKCITSAWRDGKFEKRLRELSIPAITLPLGFISKTLSWPAIAMTLEQAWKLPSLWRGYRKAINSFKPHIVLHSNFHHVVVLWPVLGRVPDVFHVHDAFATTRFYSKLFQMMSSRIRLFVGVSESVAQSLRDLGVMEGKISSVLNGVETDAITCRRVSNKVSGRNRQLRIGIVGQVAAWKGHEDLIDSLRILVDNGYSFTCRIYGTGDPEFAAKLRSRIETHQLTDMVEWMGYVDEADAIYGNIDVCVVPSRFPEPFGMVAAEAGLHGLPVVASRRGGLPEIVINDQTGYLVDAESPEQLAEKIALFLNSPQRLDEMGRKAVTHVLNKLSAQSMTEHMEHIFKALIAEEIERSPRAYA
jgi:glycosyltransferase involved in cell wall biosynthesis